MVQGKFKKQINKKVRKGNKGYPVATIAYYGFTNMTATKLVCGIIKNEDADVEPIKKWFSQRDIRESEKISREVLDFIGDNQVCTITKMDRIIGCPHD